MTCNSGSKNNIGNNDTLSVSQHLSISKMYRQKYSTVNYSHFWLCFTRMCWINDPNIPSHIADPLVRAISLYCHQIPSFHLQGYKQKTVRDTWFKMFGLLAAPYRSLGPLGLIQVIYRSFTINIHLMSKLQVFSPQYWTDF